MLFVKSTVTPIGSKAAFKLPNKQGPALIYLLTARAQRETIRADLHNLGLRAVNGSALLDDYSVGSELLTRTRDATGIASDEVLLEQLNATDGDGYDSDS